MLDPKQLDAIIYQAGVGYQSASTSQRKTPATSSALSLDIHGFAAFLTQSKCLSVLLFWKEAEEYLNMFSQKERAACAQKIFQRYLKRGAEYEVNLSGVNDTTVAAIEAKLAAPPGSEIAASMRPARLSTAQPRSRRAAQRICSRRRHGTPTR